MKIPLKFRTEDNKRWFGLYHASRWDHSRFKSSLERKSDLPWTVIVLNVWKFLRRLEILSTVFRTTIAPTNRKRILQNKMVSVFEGQLTRTWSYTNNEEFSTSTFLADEKKNKRKHIINLYHDTITGKMRRNQCCLILTKIDISIITTLKVFCTSIIWGASQTTSIFFSDIKTPPRDSLYFGNKCVR